MKDYLTEGVNEYHLLIEVSNKLVFEELVMF